MMMGDDDGNTYLYGTISNDGVVHKSSVGSGCVCLCLFWCIFFFFFIFNSIFKIVEFFFVPLVCEEIQEEQIVNKPL